MCVWRVHEINPSASSTQLVIHALPADAPARKRGNLRNSCTQFPLATVIQLLKEAGVVLATDASASASDKPLQAALPDADYKDLANMPATFDHQQDETAWQQGLLPGEVGPQQCELELSNVDSHSSAASILGVCLDGFNGDAWMSDVEGAHDDIQVGQAAGVNNPSDIPWRMTVSLKGDALGDDVNEGEWGNNDDNGGAEGGGGLGAKAQSKGGGSPPQKRKGQKIEKS